MFSLNLLLFCCSVLFEALQLSKLFKMELVTVENNVFFLVLFPFSVISNV